MTRGEGVLGSLYGVSAVPSVATPETPELTGLLPTRFEEYLVHGFLGRSSSAAASIP